MLKVLATDLDGTFLPLDGDQQHQQALNSIDELVQQHDLSLVFVTGRHFASVRQAMDEFSLPSAATVICDVGTSIYDRTDSGYDFCEAYAQDLNAIVEDCPPERVREVLENVPGLDLQEDEKQGRFKVSFYTDADLLKATADAVEISLKVNTASWSVISSVDPFNGDGLIDVLPKGVSKAYALDWYIRQNQLQPQDVAFAGDSGNDVAALTAGYRSIVVGNAAENVKKQVRQYHQQHDQSAQLHCSEATATSGVLEGLHWCLNQ
jgi:HAD superfamily hydrolase (TIGR01484 family)